MILYRNNERNGEKMKTKIMTFFKEENKWQIILYCFFLATLFLAICSRSSILYPCNNWDDANSYFSMGKFMMDGQVIYQNLYDQKGPYLYLLYGLASFISHDSFFGVFIMEIIAVTIFFYAQYKIITLYCSKKSALVFMPVLAMVTLSSLSFYWGGAAEEFCLPLLGWSLYFSLKYFKEEYPRVPGWKMIFLNGMFAGIVMQVKYTMLGYYFAWMAAMALMNFTGKNWKKSLQNCMVFLGGMVLTFLPWLLYFGFHGALGDWYQCYVYNNVFLYSDLNTENVGVGNKIYTLAKILYNLIWDNFSYFLFIIGGMLFFLLDKKVKWYEKINIYAMFGFLFLGTYIGGANIFYYSIPLMTFTGVGIGACGVLLDKLWGTLQKQKVWTVICSIMVIACFMGAFKLSMNTEYMKVKKEDHFLYKFKEIVCQEENPTLLNINMLDAGLYTVADIMPTCKFFQTNGINYDRMEEEQKRYVKEGETMFVISRFSYPEYILEKYELVAEEKFLTSGSEPSSYYLFKRK